MKKMIITGTVLLISVLVLINSIIQAEIFNPNLWWQVIGMAIITFVAGRESWCQFQELKRGQQK